MAGRPITWAAAIEKIVNFGTVVMRGALGGCNGCQLAPLVPQVKRAAQQRRASLRKKFMAHLMAHRGVPYARSPPPSPRLALGSAERASSPGGITRIQSRRTTMHRCIWTAAG